MFLCMWIQCNKFQVKVKIYHSFLSVPFNARFPWSHTWTNQTCACVNQIIHFRRQTIWDRKRRAERYIGSKTNKYQDKDHQGYVSKASWCFERVWANTYCVCTVHVQFPCKYLKFLDPWPINWRAHFSLRARNTKIGHFRRFYNEIETI